jgi:thiamine-monophosphate kinase
MVTMQREAGYGREQRSEQRSELGEGGEFDLIRRMLAERAAAASGLVRVGPGDDAAVLGDGTVLSVDMAVEDVHFRRSWLEPEEIGYRSAMAALSDLAAMAAEPVGVLAAIALRAEDRDGAIAIVRGIEEATQRCGAALLGGDVTRSPHGFVIDIAVIGRTDAPITRAGAVPGDRLWVTGELGGAAAAVHAWRQGGQPDEEARVRFARPSARVHEARWLAERCALHALIDLSDGLAGDASHVAAASGVRVVIDIDALPIARAAVAIAGGNAGEARALALTGGEDYELLFAAPAGEVEPHVAEFAQRFGSAITALGEIATGDGVWTRTADGRQQRLAAHGYQHFEES